MLAWLHPHMLPHYRLEVAAPVVLMFLLESDSSAAPAKP